MTSDLGGIYTLGVQPGAIVRNNLIYDVNISEYGGWGLYTDEGSSGILLENNAVYRCQSAGFHQHYGQTNIIRNNIFACNSEAQLMRTRLQPGISFSFSNNIVYADRGRLFGGDWGDDEIMDKNDYFDPRARKRWPQTFNEFRAWQHRGHDLHSVFADPLFVDPARDDFRLYSTSPAFALGFRPIDLRTAGIRRPFQRP
jgi:hypothetical protein